jgi:RHS repeat-associated protein
MRPFPHRHKQGGQTYSYLYDGKGNVSALLDNSQAVTATYTYDTFGNLMSQTGTLSQPFKFSTKMYDKQTGLSYFGYRFYSPATGRWMTRDPIGIAGGLNLYGFVGDDPIDWVDPFGLDTYMCTKPLDAISGQGSPGKKTGPDILGNPLYHQYICIEKEGAIICGGHSMVDEDQERFPWLWGTGTPSKDEFVADRCDLEFIRK